MKLTRSKKVILTVLTIVGILFVFSNADVFAAINDEYPGVDTVTDTALEEAFDESSLLDLLAKLVYAIGRFLEWILGTIFKMLTGVSDFPWADKIVFNAVALLDVNFINPAPQSFVGNTSIESVLQNIYSTVLSLAVAFFGIVVLITAIKLVISTIASEKAKYKQAIVDWAIGFVLLFCMHYFISFVFYLNEELVKVASNIVTKQLATADNVAKVELSEIGGQLITNAKKYLTANQVKKLEENPAVITTWMNLNSGDSSNGAHELLMKDNVAAWDWAIDDKEQFEKLYYIVDWATQSSPSVEELVEIKKSITLVDVTKSRTTCSGEGAFASCDTLTWSEYSLGLTPSQVNMLNIKDEYLKDEFKNSGDTKKKDGKIIYYITQGAKDYFGGDITNDGAAEGRFHWNILLDDLIKLKSAAGSSSGSSTGTGSRLIADLATYFRYNSYSKEFRTTNVTGLKDGGNVEIQNMIMYTILVAQSLILFISYIKRLFYVLMLALLAPIVVVVDFFQKFGK